MIEEGHIYFNKDNDLDNVMYWSANVRFSRRRGFRRYKYDNRAPTKDRVVAKKAVARSFIFQ